MEYLGEVGWNDAASNLYMWNCSYSPHTYKLVIITMQ